MNSATLYERKSQDKRRLIASGAMFAACYLMVIVIVFLMLVINDPAGWKTYIVQHYSEVLSMIVSIFFLFGIGFFYFYFEDRQFLYRSANVALYFSIVFISPTPCLRSCACSCSTAGRRSSSTLFSSF